MFCLANCQPIGKLFDIVAPLDHLKARSAIDGHTFDEELASSVSPYKTEHINRFGRYALNHDRIPEPLDSVRALRMPPRTERIERGANVAV